MNDRTDKSSYKNHINIDTTDIDSDDDLEYLFTKSTSGNHSNTGGNKRKKSKASTASDHAKRNVSQHGHAQPTEESPARQLATDVQPVLRTLDKAMIDAMATPNQTERAIEILKELKKKERVKRNTKECRNWEAVFVASLDKKLPFESSQNPKVTLYFNYRGNAKGNVPFRLQLNPSKLNERHVKSLLALWNRIFPIGSADVYLNAVFFRIDEAADKEGSLDYWILDRKQSQVVTRFYIQTGRDGKIKTCYIGESSAENGGVLYDRFSAEVFRNADGNPVPLNRETATHTLEQVKGLVRVESRRVFSKKLTYAELVQTPSAFAEYDLFDLSRLTPKDRRDTAFMGYTEMVRLRGMHGAKHRLLDSLGKTAETKRLVSDYEQRLARCECEWWNQLDRTQQLGALLKKLPANKFLKRIGD